MRAGCDTRACGLRMDHRSHGSVSVVRIADRFPGATRAYTAARRSSASPSTSIESVPGSGTIGAASPQVSAQRISSIAPGTWPRPRR